MSKASNFVSQNAHSFPGADLYIGLNAGHEILSIKHEWVPKKEGHLGHGTRPVPPGSKIDRNV
jgi:hypothetical protein